MACLECCQSSRTCAETRNSSLEVFYRQDFGLLATALSYVCKRLFLLGARPAVPGGVPSPELAEDGRTRSHLYAACVNLEGEAFITRGGEQIELRKGDIFIPDSRQEFALDLVRLSRQLTVGLPTSWIDSRVPDPSYSQEWFARSPAR
jgi:hypothetical protein